MNKLTSDVLFDIRPICVVIAADSRKVLPSFAGSVDLIVTSPPYADARRNHYDSIHPTEFSEWFRTFHDSFWNVLKPEGSLVINIKDKVVNGVRHRYVWHTIEMLTSLGWECIEDYIWHKPNPMPGYWPTRLRDGWEYCFHLAKCKRPYINQDAVRKPIGDWVDKRLAKLSDNDLTRQNSANKSGFGRNISRWVGQKTALPSNVISLPLVGTNKGHPAVFPPELPAFFIKLLSPPKGLVVDPFGGSGTTGLVATGLGRDCVLIDNNENYAKLAFEKLESCDNCEAEIRMRDDKNICYPRKKVSPLLTLQVRHGLVRKTIEKHSHTFQHAV
ncbi:MAG: site-specific DNA-methyltransferase [Sedimentisphaerales bacterium]|nr:site-specific DNA-methyltransferase [Sedimentisphaerales bacterium]